MKKKKLTPLPKLLKKAETVFNKWVRERDKELGCISCGGSVDHAGHYFSVGSHSAWRFNESNVFGQCVGCNCFKHGNLIHYRMGLVKRFGEDAVSALESAATLNKVKKWGRSELEEIIKRYEKKS
jgi:hypothetical protein